MAKKLNQRVQASLADPSEIELGGATKAYWSGGRRGHLINRFEEIGWVGPAHDAGYDSCCPKASEEDKSLLAAQFEVLAYEGSKYCHGWPPTMVFLPGAALIKAMVQACLKEERGVNGRLLTTTSSETVLQHFTDLEWMRTRAQEKAEAAAALAKAAGEAEPQIEQITAPEEDLANAAAEEAQKEDTGKRRSTKHKRAKTVGSK